MSPINKITREDIALFMETPEANNYQYLAGKSAIYPGQGAPLGLAYVALKLNGEAGEFAEHVGKAMRDDNLMEQIPDDTGLALKDNTLTSQRHEFLIKELGDQLWYIAAACRELGTTMSEVMAVNLTKLADRAERNTLRGSGDSR